MKKECHKCGKKKDIESFYKLSTSKDGRQAYCKKCQRQYSEEYTKENIEYILERRKAYRDANKERIADYHKMYYSKPEIVEKTKKYHKKYKKKNKEKLKSYWEKWLKKNKESVKKNALSYYYRNREAILAKRKQKRDDKKRSIQPSGK